MAKRLFDFIFSVTALLVLSPLLAAAAVLIAITSPGPILYRAKRAGRDGRVFVMHKFRTMHHSPVSGSAITGASDKRIFPLGAILRKTKIDELPQLVDVARGAMSVVGPRPEDPAIVEEHYTASDRETLEVRPGLVSPGSLYNYTHGEVYLSAEDAERAYVEGLLPVKLALERVYVRRRSMLYDLWIIARTAAVIVQIAAGRERFPNPPEMDEALALLAGEHSSERSASAAGSPQTESGVVR